MKPLEPAVFSRGTHCRFADDIQWSCRCPDLRGYGRTGHDMKFALALAVTLVAAATTVAEREAYRGFSWGQAILVLTRAD